jgi:hypothetical protein
MKWRSAMWYTPHLRASEPSIRPRKRPGRRVASLLLAGGLTVSAMTALAASPASAASVCAPGTDICVIADTVQTPLGPVTIAVSAANAVTVQLSPSAPSTLVIGIPFVFPPGPPTLPGYARTSIKTAGGVVNIDTFLAPPGAANSFALPDLAIVSIHPPGPCRVRTSGTTVVFTPVIPPGPPG